MDPKGYLTYSTFHQFAYKGCNHQQIVRQWNLRCISQEIYVHQEHNGTEYCPLWDI